ncbi:MAG: stage II sporulation protein P [Clostridiales bacterium]|nr:stage II sporulation protein P [Clostridiales bacterium]
MDTKKTIFIMLIMLIGLYLVMSLKENPEIMSHLSLLTGEGTERNEKKQDEQQGRQAAENSGEGYKTLTAFPPFPSEVKIPEKKTETSEEGTVILPTTIEGGLVITNDTSYDFDLGVLLSQGPSVKLAQQGAQVLIIHTHGSEAYTPEGNDRYIPSDPSRTEDTRYNVVRVGDELTACLESYGLVVIHDREIYDYPSYTGSYARSAEAISRHLSENPDISVVLDIHRDAIGSGDTVYKTLAESDGKASAQLMLLVGTGENGLPHANYIENLKFALYLQSAVVDKYPTLARPIAVKKERYNQQLTTGSLIIEVGSSGNTLEEALKAIRLFADAAGPALKNLEVSD